MSLLIENEVFCPYCDFLNQAEVWSIVNVKEDPELKNLLLGGELNLVECEACKKVFYAEKFLVYHDSDREILAFVYPYTYRDERSKWEEKSFQDYQETKSDKTKSWDISYPPLTFFGLDELTKFLLEDEEVAIQSQIVEYLSNDRAFSIKKIGLAEARKRSLPYVLPFDSAPTENKESSVLKALTKILEMNDRLSVYHNFRDRLLSRKASLDLI